MARDDSRPASSVEHMISGAPLRDERGEMAGLIGTFTDITENKRGAAPERECRPKSSFLSKPFALQELTSKLKSLLDTSAVR